MHLPSFYMILFLIIVWCGLGANFSLANIILGSSVAIIVHIVYRSTIKSKNKYHINIVRLFLLILYTTYDLVLSSIEVAIAVMQRNSKYSPAIIRYHLCCHTDVEKMLISNIISLTPGSLVVNISTDEKILYVHCMFAKDIGKIKEHIKINIEEKVMKVFNYESP